MKLTTHVLDTTRGVPAAGVAVVVRRDGEVVATATTNAGGRTDTPLVTGDAFAAGAYELEYAIGDYFGLEAPRYLDAVPIRIGVNGTAPVHVALLVTPWSYTTYRGS